ncbi:sister chromatid cohesion protein Dcc1 [Fimicolochytrium jonesii]|uniref:sister chromatid cohesion protein Dcc1 n=1 Tax=Fimicolochytrium jonesii TaxID=1396493 RepID=UPI0022FED8F8|nr:sister chromatid cohesion protein Dcc1 [Fimicolochytrium jonesii]KAI8820432.1 sister chromatid cohesion protein Dcc1 [Fimicolochytrium jonesii]
MLSHAAPEEFQADIIFSPNMHADDTQFTFLELPKEIADRYFKEDAEEDGGCVLGERTGLVIRGLESDEAVLCTPTTTYALRSVQTSNTMLLLRESVRDVDEMDTGGEARRLYEIHEAMTTYQEMVPCQPRLDRLRQLLEEAMYRGPGEEAGIRARRKQDGQEMKLYTTDDFRDMIQASDAEIQKGLEDVGAVLMDGRWRLLDSSYKTSTLKYLLISAIAEDMSIDSLPELTCVALMKEEGVPECVVRQLLRYFANEVEERDGEVFYKLSEDKIGRYLGEQLLATAELRQTPLANFMRTWREHVPENISIDIQMLKGLCLLEESPNKTVIQYFPKSLLPMDAKSRFETLFRCRKKWSGAEIMPYVEDLAPTAQKLDAVLLKFARVSRVGGTTFYTSRYAVK